MPNQQSPQSTAYAQPTLARTQSLQPLDARTQLFKPLNPHVEPLPPLLIDLPKHPRRLANLFMAFARGIALFIALYSLLSSLGVLLGRPYNQNIWWIDLNALPTFFSIALQGLLIIVLFAFVIRVPSSLIVRLAGGLLSLAFMAFALSNVQAVYNVQQAGGINLASPIPFSAYIAIAFFILAIALFGGTRLLGGSLRQEQATFGLKAANITVVALTVVLLGVLFPLGQVYCFGTTEYRNEVDATVVLGAQVQPDGTPSLALQDRLDKAISLYHQGETPVLIMSGGIDAGGVSEAAAMRNYAIKQGVPAADILIDEYGNNTEATVKNTLEICSEHGYTRIGAVSSFYHMARIKMLYLGNGHDVYTRPAPIDPNDNSALYSTLREIPGWWYYWLGSIFG